MAHDLMLAVAVAAAAAAAAAPALLSAPVAVPATGAHFHLFVDPGLVVAHSAGIYPTLANVTKEPRSPVLMMTEPWEVWLSYIWVVWDPAISRLVMYYNNEMCCDSFSGRGAACPGCENRSVLICDDSRDYPNVTGTQGNPRLSATLRAESVDGVTWTKPPLHQLMYNGSTANNALFLNQSLGGTSDGRGVFRDPHDPDPSRRYKMAGTFNRGPNPPNAANVNQHRLAAAPTAPPGYVREPGCIPAGKCITDMKKSSVAAGAAACSRLSNCASFSFYSRTGWVQLFDLNQTEHCLYNPPWTSYRNSSVPAPAPSPPPDPLADKPGYHFGTMSSPDGKVWSGFDDISYQLQARADTSNNVG
eukprot:SAG31_NODE_6979_length_1828_cov_1.880278_2_plen_360_part_00